MNCYIILLRGINVGGKNKLPMADLRTCLEGLGFSNVSTYIASGNAIVSSPKSAKVVGELIEAALPKTFTLDSDLIKVLVLTPDQLQAVVDNKPKSFGDRPEMYHSDIVFMMGITAEVALPVFNPREGVDKVWPGDGVVYSQRLSAERTHSRLSKIVGSPQYKSMTIRTWNTAIKLLELVTKQDDAA